MATQKLLALPYWLTALAMSGLFGRVADPAALMARYEKHWSQPSPRRTPG